MRSGSRGVGGRRSQLVAILLTYLGWASHHLFSLFKIRCTASSASSSCAWVYDSPGVLRRQAQAKACGADETVVADLSDDESLKNAARGIEGIFHLNPAFAPNEAQLGVSMVNAAIAMGVRKFT